MTASTIAPENFPLLRQAISRTERFDQAVRAIASGVETGTIRNVDYKAAKEALGRAADQAWKNEVSEPFFYAGRFQDQPEAVRKLQDSIMIMSLHDVLTTARKLAKTTATGPAVEAMKAYVDEVLPLAEAVASLKDKVVKGRAPRSEPAKPVNPNKIVKTCACCFRAIAVMPGGTMGHHGYQRPGDGYQTASCPGIRFRPLEVSDEGLRYIITVCEDQLSRASAALGDSDTITSLTLPGRRGQPLKKISKQDAGWANTLLSYKFGLESEIRNTEAALGSLRQRLAAWKPVGEGSA